jgi:hypothetical protein
MINNKVYFCVTGRSINDAISMQISRSRITPRKMKLKDEYTKKAPFHLALIRHGHHNFKFDVLHSRVSKKQAYAYKKKYIKNYNAMDPEYGYNCTTGGIDSFKHADHVIDSLVKAQTGKKMPESYVQLMKARVGELHPAYGHKHSKEVRARMSQAQKDSDYVQTDEIKKRKSETMKRKWQEPEFIEKMANRTRPPVTEETRKKLSKANSGKNNAMYGKKGKLNPNYGREIPQWQRDIISKKNKEHAKKRKTALIESFKNRTEKQCRICKETKPLEMFCKSYTGVDPYLGKCLSCEKTRNKAKRKKARAKMRVKKNG